MEIPREVYDEIEYQVQRLDLDCVDNRRAYKVGDESGRLEFIEAAKSGCCGSWESSAIIDGVKWIIGCNYGH